MPRLLAAEYVYSGSMDCITTSSTTTPQTVTHQQEALQLQPQQHHTTSTVLSNTFTTFSNKVSHNDNTQETVQKADEEQIHTISSSDDDEFLNEQNNSEQEIANMSSAEYSDFEGFDDNTATNSSGGPINDTNREDFMYSNYQKFQSQLDFNEYQDEAIEVEDDEEIAIAEDGNIIYMSAVKITPNKSHAYRCEEPFTPNKRTKREIDKNDNANTPPTTHLKTSPDQIVEVNSDSTTNSLKEKRQQINSKFQLNFCQHQQNHKASHIPNKCSSESTSEFPVSSPSNPQQPRGGKYPARPPLLKNTLPADSFERQLAMITVCNPQMTLAEKILSWECEEELSDVEDVNKFDEQFKRLEKQKKLQTKQIEKSGVAKNTEIKNFDVFRKMILNGLKKIKYKKFSTSGQGGVGVSSGVSGGKCVDTSGSESSKSVVHVDDRPSTSAVAQQQLQQRRSKAQLFLEIGEPKKRIIKDIPKRNQNSTTPPQTSSSDNEREYFQNSKNYVGNRQIHIHDSLICPSSSEETISQDVPTHVLQKTKNKCALFVEKNVCKKSPAEPQISDASAKTIENKILTKNSRVFADEEIDSVFRLHRPNRERDKHDHRPSINAVEELSPSIIQMRLDFTNDNKNEILKEKKPPELFKTPIIPQKYLTTSLNIAECHRQNNFLSTKKVNTSDEIIRESLTSNSLKRDEDHSEANTNQLEQKLTIDDDFDGVYHQQHEFCNYLGLTGMSTATAMANAVAELAQCNLARRSMRVLRQQQQERRDKTAKEERLMEALKSKQLKEEMHKREKEGCDIIPVIERSQTTVIKSEEGPHSQASESPASLKKTSNNSTTKSTKSQNSFKIGMKKSKIKVLCHIPAKNKDHKTEKHTSKYVKEITQPIRKISLSQAEQRKPKKVINISKQEHDNNNESNDKNCMLNKKEGSPLTKKESIRILRSSILSTDKPKQKNIKSRSQILNESKEVIQNQEIPIVCKFESVGVTLSATKSFDTKSASPCAKANNLRKDEILNEHSNIEELSIFNSGGGHLIASTSNIIQQKLQMALKESRMSKPSIFIVQSLECKKDKANNLSMKSISPKNSNLSATTTSEIKQNQENKNDLKKSTKFNKNDKKRKVLQARKRKKYPISQRQLRRGKLIVIKTLKPKPKYYENLNAIKRELRSSPKTNENNIQNNTFSKTIENYTQLHDCNEVAKSYRTVHTETKDLEVYLNKQSYQTKTRLRAKASALLERSKRMSLRGGCNLVKNKSTYLSEIQSSKHNLHGTTRTQILKSSPERNTNKTSSKIQQIHLTELPVVSKQTKQKGNSSSSLNLLELENVVVSSTTNTYDERPSNEPLAIQSPITLKSLHNLPPCAIGSSPIRTKDQTTQCNINIGIHYLNTPPLPTQVIRNPLKSDHGAVLYIYHELDILIVIQERLISFWKCSKLINMLINPSKVESSTHQTAPQSETTTFIKHNVDNECSNQIGQPATSSTLTAESNNCGEWNQLGELRRLNFDFEISVPYKNRICLHNSTPIYLEMRAQQLPKNQRDCNLLSMYINIYYYHDEDMIVKCNSIPLDSIQSDVKSVNYTTLIDSRYFIMTWPQENLLGKTRSGLCKYSLTPQLDTLASIREFKSMRHTIRYLECMSDDKLIGFGETQVSIWDYRSGDVLMNFDLEIPMGKNLGSIYFSSQDIEQNNMLILHQFRDYQNNTPPVLITIACTVTHTLPSYRVLQQINLPTPAFKVIKSAIKTGDHLVITGQNEDELWISLTNPRLMTVIPIIENSKRFYSREKSQLIELTETTLNVNSLANQILQLAAGLTIN